MNKGTRLDKSDSNPSTIAETLDKRRSAVRKILLSGGAVASGTLASTTWNRPLLNSVVLPTHAETSPDVRHGDSIEDPVFLSYTCGLENEFNDYIVTADGYINQPIANVSVRLVYTWNSQGSGNTVSPPIEVIVLTESDGTYTDTQNIGYNTSNVEVIASLPDYPEAGEVSDSLALESSISGSLYYCLSPDE